MSPYVIKHENEEPQQLGDLLLAAFYTHPVVVVDANPSCCDDFYRRMLDIPGIKLIPVGVKQAEHEGADATSEYWIDIKFDASQRETAFRHSDKRQPLHTDGSYALPEDTVDVSFFYCKQQAKYGGDTIFIKSCTLKEILEYYDPSLLERLETHKCVHQKGDHKRVCEIIRPDGELCWNYYRTNECLTDPNLIEDFHEFLETIIIQGGMTFSVNLKPGQAIFFEDQYVLHGRNAYLGDRHLVKGGFQYLR